MIYSLSLYKVSIIFVFTIFISCLCFGQEEHFLEVLDDDVQPGMSIIVVDDKLNDPNFNTEKVIINSIKNRVSISIVEGTLPADYPSTSFTFDITILGWDAPLEDNESDYSIERMETLEFEYNGDFLNETNSKVFYEFEGALGFEIIINNIESTPVRGAVPEFEIQGDIFVDRIYPFDKKSQTISTHQVNVDNGFIDVSWEAIDGAEEYDLEWAFYDLESDVVINPSYSFNQLFRNNSTRITTEQLSFSIPNLYPKGYLFYRIRGVRYTNKFREYSKWHIDDENKIPSETFFLIDWHEKDLNWQSQVSYAEEGKHVPSVNYFDGSLRQRQSVTFSNAIGHPILQQNVYDYLGRPTISVMAAPDLNKKKIEFVPLFASSSVNEMYTKENFLEENGCMLTPNAMSTENGVSNYYSKENLKMQGFNKFIPEANGYVFSTSEYTPDLTGRMRRQSGVGKEFALGSGHETKYYYSKAFQEELDLIFNDQVGVASHYQKNMVQDPNGQLSISYLDAHGRTIATSLTGNSPSNTQQLESKKASKNISKDLLNNIRDGYSQISTSTLAVAEISPYTFTYELEPKSPNFDCLPIDTCYDCVYNLRITIDDNCGNAYNNNKKLIIEKQNVSIDSLSYLCSDMNLGINESIVIPELPIGEYKVTKEISVSTLAADIYLNEFLTHNSCLPSYDEIYETILSNTDTLICDADDVIEGDLTDCDRIREMLLFDVQPGGVMAPYERDSTNNNLIITEGLLFEREFANYFETSDVFYIGEEEVLIRDMSTEQFIEFFQPEWAENLIEAHDMIGCLEDCNLNNEFAESLLKIRGIDTFEGAILNGYVDPSTCLPNISDFNDQTCRIDIVDVGVSGVHFPSNANIIINEDIKALNVYLSSVDDLVGQLRSLTGLNWILSETSFIIYASNELDIDISNSVIQSVGNNNGFFYTLGINGSYRFVPCDFGDLISPYIENLDPSSCIPQDIIDIIEQIVYCDGEFPCFTQFGKGCETDNNLAWVLYRNIYLTRIDQLLSEQFCTFQKFMIDYVNAYPDRFENPELFEGDEGLNMFPPDPENVTEESLQDQKDANIEKMLGECELNCEIQATGWLSQISPCFLESITPEEISEIERRLVAVCKNGCDGLRPLGTSTSETPTTDGDLSFEDVLSYYEAYFSDCDLDCNPKIITSPGPHDVRPYYGNNTISLVSQGLDEEGNNCYCDNLTEMQSCYNAYIEDNNGEDEYGSLSAYLGDFASVGISQSALDTLSLYCENECNALPISILIPPYLECDICKTPEDVNEALLDFDPESSCNNMDSEIYEELRALHLNAKFGYQLSTEEINDFLGKVAEFPNRCHLLCPSTFFGNYPINVNECKEELFTTVEATADIVYDNKLDSIKEAFITQYMNQCVDLTEESFIAEGTFSEHHFTLYYYDQAGNLVQTIAPQGTEDDEASLKNPSEYTFKTNYKYNSFNQVVEQLSPDNYIDINGDGMADNSEYIITKFWYDNVGRVVASQDGRQQPLNLYSYTLYDPLGRIIEVGELPIDNSENIPTEESGRNGSFANWVQAASGKKFVTKTYYDREKFTVFEELDIDCSSDNLRNRVVSVSFEVNDDQDDSTYNSATHYNYDVTGNVKTLVQEITRLHDIGHGYKIMEYEYDYISGNVNAVYYQRGKEDQFTHRYLYDENNRLVDVKTSLVETDNGLGDKFNSSQDWYLWDNEASYEYYDHGPLARAVLGENRVQACDYAYTLQGWVKGVNSSIANPTLDMGEDGTSIYTPARDAYAYTLGYFNNDYKSIDGDASFEADYSDSYFDARAPALYNGNIRNMVADIKELNQPIGYTYNYDQLHRIKSMESHKNIDFPNNSWGTVGDNEDTFSTSYEYDANGNIMFLNRNGSEGAEDILDYSYDNNSNRLNQVIDRVSPNFADSPGYISSHSRYEYDGAGNLVRELPVNPPFDDLANITWTPYGKVENVVRPNGETQFGYGPDQNRISKSILSLEELQTEGCNEYRYTFTSSNIRTFPLILKGFYVDGSDSENLLKSNVNGEVTYTVNSQSELIERLNCFTDFFWLAPGGNLAIQTDDISTFGSSVVLNYSPSNDPLVNAFTIGVQSSIAVPCCTEERVNFSIASFVNYPITVSSLEVDGIAITLFSDTSTESIIANSKEELINLLHANTNYTWFDRNPSNNDIYLKPAFEGEFLRKSEIKLLYSGPNQFGNSTNFASISSLSFIGVECEPIEQELATYYFRDAQGNVMGVYTVKDGEIIWKEQHIYGSSRLGLIEPNVVLKQEDSDPYFKSKGIINEGQKKYELTNHLGNVLAVINDRKEKISLLGQEYFEPIVITAQDYFPFGQEMGSERSFNADNTYRYGFNGKEKDQDNEFGNQTHYDYGARIYNPSIGRFLSVDPLSPDYPWYTPYQFAGNMPIFSVDVDGLEPGELLNAAEKFLHTPYEYGGKNPRPAIGLIKDSKEVWVDDLLDDLQMISDLHPNRYKPGINESCSWSECLTEWRRVKDNLYNEHGSWVDSNGGSIGIDCSGFVRKSYSADKEMLISSVVDGSSRQLSFFKNADKNGLAYVHNNPELISKGDFIHKDGHVMIATGKIKKDPNGNVVAFQTIEARGTQFGVVYHWRDFWQKDKNGADLVGESEYSIAHPFRHTDTSVDWEAEQPYTAPPSCDYLNCPTFDDGEQARRTAENLDQETVNQ